MIQFVHPVVFVEDGYRFGRFFFDKSIFGLQHHGFDNVEHFFNTRFFEQFRFNVYFGIVDNESGYSIAKVGYAFEVIACLHHGQCKAQIQSYGVV